MSSPLTASNLPTSMWATRHHGSPQGARMHPRTSLKRRTRMQFCCCSQDPKGLNNQCVPRPRQPCRGRRLLLRHVSLALRSQRPCRALRRPSHACCLPRRRRRCLTAPYAEPGVAALQIPLPATVCRKCWCGLSVVPSSNAHASAFDIHV